jgi:hypothetical protein
MAFLAELLFRRCNAAIPAVDTGTDAFAFHDTREEVARAQVKTAQGVPYKKGDGYSAQFSIPVKQLQRPDKPPLYYALVVRLEGKFVDFLILSRAQVSEFFNGPKRFGTRDKDGNLILTVQFREQVLCGEVDLTAYRNAWHLLPPLRPVPELTEGAVTDQTGVEVEETSRGEPLPPAGPSPAP